MSEFTSVNAVPDFENATVAPSRSQIDSTLSPKEGKWL